MTINKSDISIEQRLRYDGNQQVWDITAEYQNLKAKTSTTDLDHTQHIEKLQSQIIYELEQ